MIVRGYTIAAGADLRNSSLWGADLRGADLKGAELTGAYLSGAELTGAYLTGAYLSGADLSGAYLTGADLRGAELTGADLSGADLRIAWFKETKVTADQLMWLTLSGQFTPAQASRCKVLKTKDKQMVDAG